MLALDARMDAFTPPCEGFLCLVSVALAPGFIALCISPLETLLIECRAGEPVIELDLLSLEPAETELIVEVFLERAEEADAGLWRESEDLDVSGSFILACAECCSKALVDFTPLI